jgi:predicted nucleotide-binding protein
MMPEGIAPLEEESRRRNVYIVYGQNIEERKKIDSILQDFKLLSLVKNDIVGLAGGSPFIGDILNIAFERAQAVIVLLTCNEEARLRENFRRYDDKEHEKSFRLQPTQDQIFEAGYAFGKSPERTILIQVGEVRPFSDIEGRYVLNYADTLEDTNLLRACLLRAGCIVNNTGSLSPPPTDIKAIAPDIDTRRVFVVHGRNMIIMKELFAFLRALDLSPMEWYEAIGLTKGGASYIGEIVSQGLDDAQVVVILLTGDDEVRQSKEGEEGEELSYPQARPNVLFEAGLAFSRYENRTILVQVGRVRPCPDLRGRTMVRLSDSPGSRWDFMHRLRIVGCKVNFDGKWNTTGNFTIADG